jgi:hypothetical protein
MWIELNARSKPIASYDDAGCLAFYKYLPIRIISALHTQHTLLMLALLPVFERFIITL